MASNETVFGPFKKFLFLVNVSYCHFTWIRYQKRYIYTYMYIYGHFLLCPFGLIFMWCSDDPIRENRGPLLSEMKTKMRKLTDDDRHQVMIIPYMSLWSNTIRKQASIYRLGKSTALIQGLPIRKQANLRTALAALV